MEQTNQPVKKYFSEPELIEMGVTLLKEWVAQGNTIVTDKRGVEALKKMEILENQYQEMKFKTEVVQPKNSNRKPVHKYPSNYQPPKSKNRKAKSMY